MTPEKEYELNRRLAHPEAEIRKVAFFEWWQLQQDEILKMILRRVQQEKALTLSWMDETEEVMSEVQVRMLGFFLVKPFAERGSSLMAFAFTFSKHVMHERWKDRTRYLPIEGENSGESPYLFHPDLRTEDTESLERLDTEHEHKVVRSLLPHLGKRQRDLIWLRYWEGLSNSEIAHRLGISIPYVRVELTRARKKLGKLMSPHMQIFEDRPRNRKK